jgi:hypothetical protein
MHCNKFEFESVYSTALGYRLTRFLACEPEPKLLTHTVAPHRLASARLALHARQNSHLCPPQYWLLGLFVCAQCWLAALNIVRVKLRYVQRNATIYSRLGMIS